MSGPNPPLNPGSPEAVRAGCTCPVMDNGQGRGAYRQNDGSPVFWFKFDCPIHGKAEQVGDADLLVPLTGDQPE